MSDINKRWASVIRQETEAMLGRHGIDIKTGKCFEVGKGSLTDNSRVHVMSKVKFEREPRYLVIKLSKLDGGYASGCIYPDAKLAKKIEKLAGSALVDCVVVEADWPEYEPVWEMIESRMAGYPSLHPQRLRADTAETERDALKYDCQVANSVINAQKSELAATGLLIGELRELLNIVRDDTGEYYSENLQSRILAALNPNPEAGSHE